MRLKLAWALAALPFATTANAANIYMACYYQDDATGAHPITRLFTLKGDAIADSYPTWSYEGIKDWEAQFATKLDEVRGTSDYTDKNIIGQFAKFAEARGDSHSSCVVTTMKPHALAWFQMLSAKSWFKLDVSRIADWRPDSRAGVVAVTDWSGNAIEGATADGAEDKADTSIERSEAIDGKPSRHKMTNAEADAKYAADMAEYSKQLAEREKQVEDYKRAQNDLERIKQEQKLQVERAAAEYRRQLEAHAQTVRNQQLEYQKELAHPKDVPNAVYRGFWGPDCATARLTATQGAGTSSTTRFREVTTSPDSRGCIAQGWWWNLAGEGTATRQ
jgi:hypothetical protein